MPYIGLSMCHALLEGSTKFRTDTTTFLLKKYPWKWETTAQEAHGVQVLPDSDLGSLKVTHSH